MRISVTIIGLLACSTMICACKPSDGGGNASTANATESGPTVAKKPDGTWLAPQSAPVTTYPALTKGSPYVELLNTVISDWGKAKSEFESTPEFNARISSIPNKVTAKFGKFFSFKSNLPETAWNADTKTFKILHTGEFKEANNINLGLEAPVMYGLNVQRCADNPTLKLTSEQARKIKTGLDAGSIGLFYVGTIDFPKKGWVAEETLLNHETIPGFHATAIQGSDGGTGVWDFDYNVSRIDIVEASSGNIVATVKCSR